MSIRHSKPRHFAPLLVLAAVLLCGCAGTPKPEAEAAGATVQPAAAPADEPPAKKLEVHEASAQCWMKFDKTAGSLEAKSKLVDKCIDEKMKGQKKP
jgi:hypothetical protein